jgi:hypothetical protein
MKAAFALKKAKDLTGLVVRRCLATSLPWMRPVG